MRITSFLPLSAIAISACAYSPDDARGVARDETLLQVAATGRADTRPDVARFAVGVQTIAANSRAAAEQNNEEMEVVVNALAEFGIAEKDIQTKQLTINRIDWGKDRGRYSANNVVEVRVREIDKAGDALAAATGEGANVLWGPNLEISDPEAANRSAYAAAYKAARERADTYAEAAGLRVSRVLTIRDGGFSGSPYPRPMDAMAIESAQVAPPPPVSAPPVRPGETTSQVSVRVDFALAAP